MKVSWIRVGLREYALQWLAAVLALVCLGLVIAVFAHFNPRRPQGACSGAAATCDDQRVLDSVGCGGTCRTGYRLPVENVCLPTIAPAGTSCADACHVENATGTSCGASGACASAHPPDCRGYCTSDADCAAIIPLNPFWLTEVDPLDNERIFLNHKHVCYYNKCELFTLDRFWQAETQNYGTAVAGYNRCDDYLDAAFVEARGGCLTKARYLLSPNLTNAAFYPPSFSATPSQFSMCLFYYDCAAINQLAILKRDQADGASLPYHDFRRVQALSPQLF
jgi:hypothetical protein